MSSANVHLVRIRTENVPMKAYELKRGQKFRLTSDDSNTLFEMINLDGMWCNVTWIRDGRFGNVTVQIYAADDVELEVPR